MRLWIDLHYYVIMTCVQHLNQIRLYANHLKTVKTISKSEEFLLIGFDSMTFGYYFCEFLVVMKFFRDMFLQTCYRIPEIH